MISRLALLFSAAVAAGVLVRPAAASCGSASCSVDPIAHEPSAAGRLRLDLSFQYVDQDTPRVGARPANVGQDPNPDHNEVRSINRMWNARLDYDFSPRWGVAVALPVLARTHDHIDTASGDLNRWKFTGAGDLMVETRFAAWRGEGERSPALTLLLTGKFPTGRTGAHNADDRAEVPIQPGSGSYDAIAGAVYSVILPKLIETPRVPTAFAGASYRKNNPGSSGYVVGDVFDGRLGASVPVASRLDLMAQADWRVRRRDQAGQTTEDVSFTGGQSLHLSPGLRWHFGAGVSAYGFVQLPVYQYVNREQLTSDANWHGGLSWEFAAPALSGAREF